MTTDRSFRDWEAVECSPRLVLEHFGKLLAAGGEEDMEYLPWHYFFPLSPSHLSWFRHRLSAILLSVGRQRGKSYQLIEIPDLTGENPAMTFELAGRVWMQKHRAVLSPLSGGDHAWVMSPHLVSSFEALLLSVFSKGQIPALMFSCMHSASLLAAGYWHELSRGRFGSVELPLSTLLILAGAVPPSSFPVHVRSLMCIWNLPSAVPAEFDG